MGSLLLFLVIPFLFLLFPIIGDLLLGPENWLRHKVFLVALFLVMAGLPLLGWLIGRRLR